VKHLTSSGFDQRSREACSEWRPVLLDASSERDRSRADELVGSGAVRWVHDTLESQLSELMETREPAESLSADQMKSRLQHHVSGRPLQQYGTWVYYPWSQRLVHLLPEDEYFELRTSRNRNKISCQEQKRLGGLRVGVVGLSVGQTTATTMVMEGIGKEFRLADFDSVSTSNLNRLRCGVHELGLNKAIVTARQMFEINPYLTVVVLSDGIDETNLDPFLSEPGHLDIVFEQCDRFFYKLRIRERARHFGIPVLMDTNDRGLLDVERFDREPERPLLHGLLGTVTAEQVRQLSPKEVMGLALAIIEGRPSPGMAASLPEIGRTIKTWPQLASDIALGAALNVDAARRIALGSFTQSRRISVDLDEIVRDDPDQPATHQTEGKANHVRK
jgi:hypothetical protein